MKATIITERYEYVITIEGTRVSLRQIIYSTSTNSLREIDKLPPCYRGPYTRSLIKLSRFWNESCKIPWTQVAVSRSVETTQGFRELGKAILNDIIEKLPRASAFEEEKTNFSALGRIAHRSEISSTSYENIPLLDSTFTISWRLV